MEDETSIPQTPDTPLQFTENADTASNWVNRRFMAYIALFSLVGLAISTLVIGILSVTVLEVMMPVISVFVMAFSTIVGAYMGLATYADKWSIATKVRK